MAVAKEIDLCFKKWSNGFRNIEFSMYVYYKQ